MTTAFLSYSWDDAQHIAWARALCERLKVDGFSVTIDTGRKALPVDVRGLTEQAVQTHDYVLVVCTPNYRALSEKGGAGGSYAGDILVPGSVTSGNLRKIIPILRRGEWGSVGALWLSEYYIDLREGPRSEAHYQDLLATLRGVKGRMSRGGAPSASRETRPAEEPIKIIGVITTEVGVPKFDGSSMSAFYRVPLKLSRVALPPWEALFERNWNHSPRFASLRRSSIALVNGDRITMSCTTLEEVLHEHRVMLVECVNETNRQLAQKEAEQRQKEEEFRQRQEEHRRRVQELAEKTPFDW